MKNKVINNQKFVEKLTPETIDTMVMRIAQRLNEDYKGKCPLLLAVLNGSFMYAADLVRYLGFEHELQFIKLASYEGMQSTGSVQTLIGIDPEKIKGRDIIIIEDIVDTGRTLKNMMPLLSEASSVEITSMVFKKDKLETDLNVKYPALILPGDPFVLGYGMDYDGLGRNLSSIYYHVQDSSRG